MLTRAAQVGAPLGKGVELLAQQRHADLRRQLGVPPARGQLAHVVAAHCTRGGGQHMSDLPHYALGRRRRSKGVLLQKADAHSGS